jgi:hypothetical protein
MSDERSLTGSLVKRSESIVNLAKSLAAAQGEMHNPKKDTPNTFFKSLYADLAAVRDCVIPVLSKHKLAVMQLITEHDEKPACITILMHESGEYIETTMYLRPVKQDPQGIGSASTYARRYQLQSIAGVAAEADDDGNHASGGHTNGNGHAKKLQPQPKQDPEEAPDTALVDDLERTLRECISLNELETCGQLVALKKDKLTERGRNYLAGVWRELKASLPVAENMDAEPQREPHPC